MAEENGAQAEAVDKNTVKRLIKWIIEKEADNNSSKNRMDDGAMVQAIGKHIQSEVN